MEDISILEELCDMVFEKAQPQTESYKRKRSNAAEAGERLRKTLTNKSGCLKNATTHWVGALRKKGF